MSSFSLEIEGLSKSFGKFMALDNVTINVLESEVYAYIGPNGAGKTTTIRIILGILKASQGSVRVFGLDAWKNAVEIHRRIAYVPGDVSLWPNLSGGEVIDLFVGLRGRIDQERRNHLIELFDLDPSKKCRTYSKGNRQKVALIAAFASDADLYILDEPSSGLDPLMEQVFQDYVIGLKQSGKSVFLSSHILSEVERLCDRVGIIREGRLVETGTLSELRHLTRVQMTVATARPLIGLEGQKGVHEVAKKQDAWIFSVDSADVGDLVSYLGGFGVLRIESTPPTLEDLFMRHYSELGRKPDEESLEQTIN
ncbi:MAG: ABC transporter ATP-binding protein [Coriobacteriia bacterium]|nr:ABC transporter ATP-binding protein [Coriobacteriia bacterium]